MSASPEPVQWATHCSYTKSLSIEVSNYIVINIVMRVTDIAFVYNMLAVWRSGSAVRRMNEVALR